MVFCSLAGCSGEKADTASKSEQIETLYKARKEWEINDYLLDEDTGEEIELEDYAYAVTDLDFDGRYEVLVSGWAGTGHFSHNRVYEYESPGKVCKWDMDGMNCDDSEPDLLLQNEIQGIYGAEDGSITAYVSDGDTPKYLLIDKEYWGAGEGKIRYLMCVINDNEPKCSLINSMKFDMESETITEEQINKMLADTFEDRIAEKISIEWFTDPGMIMKQKNSGISQGAYNDVKYVSLIDLYDYEDDETLKNGMCMEIQNSVSENQFMSYFFEDQPDTVIVEDSKSRVYIGENNGKNVFVAIINFENEGYPKYAYGFKYSLSDAVTEAKFDASKTGEDIFDALYSLEGDRFEKADWMKPLSDDQEKTCFKDDENKNIKVEYRADPYGEGCYRESGEVFFDKKGRPWYRDYYMTSGRGFSYYLYDDDNKLTQYIDFGGMPYKGLEEDENIAIGVNFETYIFER